jgi:AcrR family transcriptional regulator
MPRSPATTPRKKPRQVRSQQTVDVLLEATARVLVKTGYDRASTNRIAEEAGVSVGSLYQYYPNKEALVAALIERHSGQIRALVLEQMGRVACAPLPEAVRVVVAAVFEAHLLDPKLHQTLHEQVPRVGRLARLLDDMREVERALVLFFEARRCELAPRDLTAAAHVVVAATEAALHGAALHGRPDLDPKAVEGALVEMILCYLTSPRGQREITR